MNQTPRNEAAVLFEPFQLGSLKLRNRIVMAPMTRNHSPGGIPGPDVAEYYARRARGGAALIISEGAVIDHPAAASSDTVPCFHETAALAGWARVASAVHAADGLIMVQLWHVGTDRKRDDPPVPGVEPVGPSGIYRGQQVTEPMPVGEIEACVASFARSARAAKELGFDGIELHGAHGYLIDQFLWPRTNRRTDRYGSSAANRARFAAEVVQACRAEVGPEFPIVLRISQWKVTDFDGRIASTPSELSELLEPITEATVDAYHCSTRRYWEAEFDGSNLNLAGWVKKLTGKPTITVGSVGLNSDLIATLTEGSGGEPTSVAPLLRMLSSGECDLVAVGRALLADPAWPIKIMEGRLSALQSFEASMLETLT